MHFHKIILLMAGALCAAEGYAQQYPAKPLKMIVPFPAGGPTDLLARLVAQKLTETWSHQVLVDNRPGGGGSIGAEASLNKIFWSEMDLKLHEAGLALLGPGAELMEHAPAAGDVGSWLDGFLFALAGPFYAGTNEIQRNVIAERLLGLPRK